MTPLKPDIAGQHAGTRDILSVSELNRRSRQLLEIHLANVWVEGELSNIAQPRSGHWYFTLKDDKAQLRCAMFRNRNQLLRFVPREGEQVLVRGRVSLYEGRGDYQLVAAFMEPAGEGELRLKLEQLRQRLQAEGLFEQTAKMPLPQRPVEVAIITSPTGAALHDFITVLRRRSASIDVTILPVAVQGEQAVGQIVQALQIANAGNATLTPEVIVLARGGGSIEDLWPFNDEAVARAIFASRIPVISAVGHETDVSISDMVADLRASTPSVAAELLSQDDSLIPARLEQLANRLVRLVSQQITTQRLTLERVSRHVRHPRRRLEEMAQRSDQLAARLQHALPRQLEVRESALKGLETRIMTQSPEIAINRARLQLKIASNALQHAMHWKLERWHSAIQRTGGVLDAISPLATLGRGYAILRDAQQKIVTDSHSVNVGEEVSAQLSQGALLCEVKGRNTS